MTRVLIFVLLLASTFSLATEDDFKPLPPIPGKGPQATLRVKNCEGYAACRYSGQQTLQVRYRYGWSETDADEQGRPITILELYPLHPDELPHYPNHPVHTIGVHKPDQAAQRLIGREAWQKIHKNQHLAAEGSATVVIQHYAMSVECDDLNASAELVAILKRSPVQYKKIGTGGC